MRHERHESLQWAIERTQLCNQQLKLRSAIRNKTTNNSMSTAPHVNAKATFLIYISNSKHSSKTYPSFYRRSNIYNKEKKDFCERIKSTKWSD